MKCSSVIGVNESVLSVSKEPTAHNVHEELTKCRIAVLRATTMMKEQAKNDTNASISKSLKSLTDSKFSLADIIDPFIGGLKQFSNFRGTLTKARAKTVSVLPTKLEEIDFPLSKYKEYNSTN